MLHSTWIECGNMIHRSPKRYWGHPNRMIECNLGKKWKTNPSRCPKNTFPEVFHIKLSVLAFNIKWTNWRSYQLIDVNCDFVIDFCLVLLVKITSTLLKFQRSIDDSNAFCFLSCREKAHDKQELILENSNLANHDLLIRTQELPTYFCLPLFLMWTLIFLEQNFTTFSKNCTTLAGWMLLGNFYVEKEQGLSPKLTPTILLQKWWFCLIV